MTAASKLATFAQQCAAAQLCKIQGQIRAASATATAPEVERIHQLRVAIRRFDQMGAIAKKSDAPDSNSAQIVPLGEIMTLAGAIRNHDIALKLVSELRDVAPSECAEATSKLCSGRAQSWRLLADALEKWDAPVCETEIDVPEDMPVDIENLEFRRDVSRLLVRLSRNFIRRGNKVASHLKAAPLHKFRLAAKRFRYSMELFEPALPLKPWIDEIKCLQDLLGEANDCRASRQLLRQYMGKRGAPKLRSALRASQKQEAHEFQQLWDKRFGKTARAHRWLKGLKAAVEPA